MRFLAIPGIVSLPLFTIQGSNIDIIYGSYDLLNGDFVGLNGNVLFVMKYAPKINARIRWLLGRNYIWVWERNPWLRNDAKIGVPYVGSSSDAMVKALITALGINVQVINYDDIDELVNNYEAGRMDAMALSIIHMHKINDAPSYPIDKLFMEYLGQVTLAPYAIAAKDEVSEDIKSLYELGAKNLAKADAKVLQELLGKFDIRIPESTLNFILSNVKFNLINMNVENNVINLINGIYGDEIDKIIKSTVGMPD